MDLIDRRSVVAGVGGLVAATALFGRRALAQSSTGSAKVVVIGGGPGGATMANALKRGAPDLSVTLVEPAAAYTSCFFSNHYIAGLRTFESITHSYRGLKDLGITVLTDRAAAVDTAARTIALAGGSTLAYDRLIVAPGIDFKFDGIEGYSEAAAEIFPHAWKGGVQSQLLKQQLDEMDDGGVVLLAAPRNPFRCPPGPYERACFIAHHLKTKKPKSKLIIVDPKMAFSKQPVFEEAFAKYYKDVVELHLTNDIDDFALAKVDTASREVTTKSGLKVKVAVANIVPDQRAGNIAAVAGLTKGDWCPVDPKNFSSLLAKDVYVVGDAAIAAEMPKSAYSAHSQAHAVAGDILADLSGKPQPANTYHNVCWSTLALDDSVKIGADYAPGEVAGKPGLAASNSFVSHPGESAAVRKTNYTDSIAWYDTLMADIFAKNLETQELEGRGAAPHAKSLR